MDKMFETASILKLRFNYKGILTVEDLWDLTVEELDSMYMNLNKELKDSAGESLLGISNSGNDLLKLRIEIIRHIVVAKLAEREKAENAAAKTAMKQKLQRIRTDKEDQILRDMSLEDLAKLEEEL